MAQRRRHGGAFKARVAVEAIAGHKTVNEIAGAYEVHPSQVAKWKAEALKRLPEVLSDGRKGRAEGSSEAEARLYQQIGRLTMEVEYLKKKLGLCRSVKYEEVYLKDYEGVDEARQGRVSAHF
jgi:putative transposase